MTAPNPNDFEMTEEEDEAMSVGVAFASVFTLLGGGVATLLGFPFWSGALATGAGLFLLATMGMSGTEP